ncbi:MAG: tRNA pseudouridine(38-40) synthase TruA [Armatimonadetes bacterium RBG_16_58_9]|nr:MAG: tRNA pseudouridine(38-40) synthase TruA [Armatimonadetes bacterium RBG_16_58_9]
MRNVKVVVEYDGTDYFGFQYQPNVPTIQGELERVLGQIVKEEVTVYASGRTDAGVHAAGQVINFHTGGTIPVTKLCVAMNSTLPDSIVAVEAEEVDERFHARHSAVSRLYRYDILNAEVPSALVGRHCWHVRKALDADAMDAAGKSLLGVHDFSSFACSANDEQTTVREIMEIGASLCGQHVIIETRANAFLRSMVRVIVGTLAEVGLGKRPSSAMPEILEAKSRKAAGKTAPARGLCLIEVRY